MLVREEITVHINKCYVIILILYYPMTRINT